MRILYTLLEHTGPTFLLSSPRQSSHFRSCSKTSFSRSCYTNRVKSTGRRTNLPHYTSERGKREALTVLLGSIYTFRRDLIVPYFFVIARANLGWTLGIAIRDMNLSQMRRISIVRLDEQFEAGMFFVDA